jgi:hypothetical protein
MRKRYPIFSEYQIEKDKIEPFLKQENINTAELWTHTLGSIFGGYKSQYFPTKTGIYCARIKDEKYDLDHTTLCFLYYKYVEIAWR